MIRKQIESHIEKDFIEGVQDIFRGNLAFGFLCGGIAKGYWDQNHDIDMFICIKRPINHDEAVRYLEWYNNLHQRHGFPPDEDYPGEIIEQDTLISTLERLYILKLKLEVDEMAVKEAIIWADMLVGGKTGLVGEDLDLYHGLVEQYKKYPEQWKQEVLAQVTPEEREEWRDKSYLLIMEKFMQYPQNDAREFYRKYSIET